MRDEDRRDALALQIAYPCEALHLKLGVAHGEDLVDEQHVGLEVRRNRKSETHVHAGGVPLDRRVDEPFDAGEFDDVGELGRDLAAAHAKDRGAQEDVLATGQFRMKAGTDLDERRQPPVDRHTAAGRRGDAGQQLEQRALASAVPPDDADRCAAGTSNVTSFNAQKLFALRRMPSRYCLPRRSILTSIGVIPRPPSFARRA